MPTLTADSNAGAPNAGERRRPATLAASVISGLIGGGLMAIWLMWFAAATGMGALMPLRLMGASLYGIDGLVGGVGPVVAGATIHLVTSLVWGLLFGICVLPRAQAGSALVGGLVLGMVALLVMTYVVMPTFDPVMAPRIALAPGAWFFGHVLYGAGVSLTPALARELIEARLQERAGWFASA